MINLLPPKDKVEIRAARVNVILLRYIMILLGAIVFLGLFMVGIYLILTSINAASETAINTSNDSSSGTGSVKTQTEVLKASLDSAKSVIQSEVRYTKLITTIAGLVPKGVILDKLSLNPQTIGAATTLQAYATNTDTAISLKDAFQSSPLFSNVSIQTISSTTGTANYPVNIVLSVTINPGAAQ